VPLTPLPIDAHLPAALAALDASGALVLTAPPGAGKSTRLPAALVGRGSGQVYLLQPRRVAARSLARRIAAEQGWQLGREVGYRVRFERVGGRDTRLWVMTEGTLTRQLQSDPGLDGVATVVLDEFHERSLHTDLCLAWLGELRRSLRVDLRVVVMSATMDPAPVARFLAIGGVDAPVIQATVPAHPVVVRLLPGNDRDRNEDRVLAAVTTALAEGDDGGDVLVFLPGTGEIRGCQQALAGLAAQRGCVLLPLHGSLPPDEQDRALMPAAGRKIVLATNVAETSLTIPGVTVVIDSGLARVARFDADSGLDGLHLERISRASADQRAGRAGRTAPGRCLRLWSRLEDLRLDPANDPEIARVDLAPTLLALKDWYGPDPRVFPWFIMPEAERIQAGEDLLAMLGASERPYGPLTALGRRLVGLPVHPRLARLIAAAQDAGALRLGATLAALVEERDLRPPRRPHDLPADPGSADAIDRLDALARAESANFRPTLRNEGIDPQAAREVARARDDLLSALGADGVSARDDPTAASPTLVARLLLAAFPDRVGKRAAPTANRVALVGGIGAEIDRASALAAAATLPRPPLLLATSVQGMSGRGRQSVVVRQAAELTEDDLAAVFPGSVQRRELLSYDAQRGAVQAVVGYYYQDLALRLAHDSQADPAAVSACLAQALRSDARALIEADEACRDWLRRIAWLRDVRGDLDLPVCAEADLGDLVGDLCAGCRTRVEVAAKPILSWLEGRLTHIQRQALERLAPSHLAVPSGSRIRLDYSEAARPPVLAVRIQELFGLRETPRLADGRVSVLLHLLAPNMRVEQVTQDLASFWANTWPQVRKDLRARYPKHPWPEDPYTALPVAKGRPRNQ